MKALKLNDSLIIREQRRVQDRDNNILTVDLSLELMVGSVYKSEYKSLIGITQLEFIKNWSSLKDSPDKLFPYLSQHIKDYYKVKDETEFIDKVEIVKEPQENGDSLDVEITNSTKNDSDGAKELARFKKEEPHFMEWADSLIDYNIEVIEI